MANFKCKKCNKEKEIATYTIKVTSEGLVSEEAVCCKTFMERTYTGKGFGGIKKGPNGTVKKK
jgi:hypothetical protein|tara:strand:+ start:183 stop:371 length:189 start_codon:yes stop_codon:yes gene_type:complete